MFAGKRRMGQRERPGGGKGLVCISVSVLRVCFLVSVLVVKGGMKYTLVVCSIYSG